MNENDARRVDLAEGQEVIPLIREELVIEKAVRELGAVELRKQVVSRTELVELSLLTETLQVRREVVDRYVDVAPEIVTTDDEIIIPVLEEVLVVEKRLILKERLHVQKNRTQRTHSEEVVLRQEQFEVIRRGGDGATLESDVTRDAVQQEVNFRSPPAQEPAPVVAEPPTPSWSQPPTRYRA